MMNQNDLLYDMFLNTMNQMDEKALKENLDKAKSVLSANDYEKLLSFIENEWKKKTDNTN